MIDIHCLRRCSRLLPAAMAAVLLLAGCQTARMGGEMVEVKEADQPVIFSAPGLEGGFRSFKYGDPLGRNHELVIASYGPRQGILPHASVYLLGARGGMHFTSKNSVMKEMLTWHFHKDRTLTEQSSGRAANALGAIEYSLFQSNEASCLGFQQFFGQVTDAGYGTDRFTGYYRAPEGITLSDTDAKSILKRLGHRTKGMPKG
jgi:hypothetical protein